MRHQPRRAAQLRERGAEPLAVGRVAPLEQEAETHQIAHQGRRNHCRPDIIPNLPSAADECLLLRNPRPLRGQQVTPDIGRVVGEPGAYRFQLTQAVMKDATRGDFQQLLLRHE
jgi:hypothetical protein